MTAQARSASVPTVALWDRPAPLGRDRASRLTPEQIAQAAFDIADSDGLLATSVKRVANRLGVPSLRLQQYVTSREDVFDLMLDQALAQIPEPLVDTGVDWRGYLSELAIGMYGVAQRHPWLVDLVGGRSPNGPNGLGVVERSLSVLGSSGLDTRTAALCLNSMVAYVCGSVRIETRYRPAAEHAGAEARHFAAAVVSGEFAGRFPHVSELFSAAADITSSESFEQGLRCLLDGIAGLAAPVGVGAMARGAP